MQSNYLIFSDSLSSSETSIMQPIQTLYLPKLIKEKSTKLTRWVDISTYKYLGHSGIKRPPYRQILNII